MSECREKEYCIAHGPRLTDDLSFTQRFTLIASRSPTLKSRAVKSTYSR